MKHTAIAAAAAAALLMFPGAQARANEATQPQPTHYSTQAGGDVRYWEQWNSNALAEGVRVEQLLGMDVRGVNGESLGEVENVILSRDGTVRHLIVDSGGVLGLGEIAHRIPWQQVRMAEDADHLMVPLAEDNLERFRWGAENVQLGANELFAESFVGAQIALADGMRIGEVEDLIISRDGRVQAFVVESDLNDEMDRVVLPFQGPVAYNTWSDHYTLPFDRMQFRELGAFDYDSLDIDAPQVGSTMGSAGGQGSYSSDRK